MQLQDTVLMMRSNKFGVLNVINPILISFINQEQTQLLIQDFYVSGYLPNLNSLQNFFSRQTVWESYLFSIISNDDIELWKPIMIGQYCKKRKKYIVGVMCHILCCLF